MSKVFVEGDRVTVRGYRRQGRSPRKVLAALRAAYADQLLADLTAYRNRRRQLREDAKGAQF